MTKKMMVVLSAATAAVLWHTPAQAQTQDLKSTNGAACVPIVESTGVPSSANVLNDAGARFSTQSVPGGSGQARRLLFVCPIVRDDVDGTFPVGVAIRLNTFNAQPPGSFTCKLKVVDQQGATIAQTTDVLMGQGFDSKVLSAPIFATQVDQAYVLTCRVPNVVGVGERSGIISYKWSEESL